MDNIDNMDNMDNMGSKIAVYEALADMQELRSGDAELLRISTMETPDFGLWSYIVMRFRRLKMLCAALFRTGVYPGT